jgi:hypothetical protein
MGSNSNTRGCILEPPLTTHQFLILPYVHTSIYHAVIHHSYLTRDRLTRAIEESWGGATAAVSDVVSCHHHQSSCLVAVQALQLYSRNLFCSYHPWMEDGRIKRSCKKISVNPQSMSPLHSPNVVPPSCRRFYFTTSRRFTNNHKLYKLSPIMQHSTARRWIFECSSIGSFRMAYGLFSFKN